MTGCPDLYRISLFNTVSSFMDNFLKDVSNLRDAKPVGESASIASGRRIQSQFKDEGNLSAKKVK